ncbi:DUF5132 domain-containing protein [Lyngbya aestuarii]|uniref:DUF5132 domain-containing protein n=1 Tax=Lyngbya aestuarii TaxID=118322 RepID=UPI00403E25DF
MSLDLGDFVEELGVPGLFIGVGAVILAPIFGPTLAKVGKPLAKSAMKAGIIAYGKSKVIFAEAGEAFQELLAESKAELAGDEINKAIEGSQAP